MDDKNEMNFPGPCYACGKGMFTGADDRTFLPHVRHCKEAQEKAKVIGSWKRSYEHLRPDSHRLPDFTQQPRFGDDDR